jgi:hypothetical protein
MTLTPITISPPTAVAASHFIQLRNAVNAMRAAAALAPSSWSGGLAAGQMILAAHINELRTSLDAARATLGLAAISYGETITANTKTIKKQHLDEIRGGVQ